MLSIPWDKRQSTYQFVIVGSGYGGSIMAARLAAALNQPHAVCILERGKEWQPGEFPDDVPGILRHTRSNTNPLGLYEFLPYRDISVIKGSGLGGTSLINANVAIVPDPEVFGLVGWPRSLRYDDMKTYYERARAVLAARPVPQVSELLKFHALDRRARQLDRSAEPLHIAVNFDVDGPNAHGVEQHPCIRCGDCISGCNFKAKNTLDMNYLPMAAGRGADIFTQVKVEWIEKLPGGGWRVHGRWYRNERSSKSFTLDARHVVLSAGSINSTEILLRSEMHGLSVSPALGTGFSGNGDFFGLAYNGDFQTDVLGYGGRQPAAGNAQYPGPSIVGIVRYNGSAPPEQRITIEDFSFPSAYVAAAKTVFAAIRGDDTVLGNEAAQQRRVHKDFDPGARYAPDGALNHTMLYLVMGHDDARGTMNFDAPWHERDGRMTIEWDQVGQQIVFRRMNEELRRHARALRANYISNPIWNVFQTRHLVTAHPLGGCPMGEDYLHGAVDEFGRVFAGDGSVHEGLFVSDGAVIPSALGVNPFLTISALAERIAERKIEDLQGQAYPQRAAAVAVSGLDPLEVIHRSEPELEKLFRRCPTLGIETLLNQGGVEIDTAKLSIRNDAYWNGFFPKGHILNAMSSAIFTGFKKTFQKKGKRYVGITNDTDGRITAHNSLEEITVTRKSGTLEPGRYILLKYLDPQWAAFYDILKPISDDLVIGRVYLGEYPNGVRLFTFVMSRKYGFAQMTVSDHLSLYQAGTVPSKEELNGVWQMDLVSNNNHLGRAAHLAFDLKPDGRLEARYQLMGLLEGMVIPSFAQDHFQLNDFTPFRDEIRKVTGDLFVGRYVTRGLPGLSSVLNGPDLGVLHAVPGSSDFGVYYTLSRTGAKALPTSPLLAPFLEARLPDGVGMTFDETMTGWYFEDASTEAAGKPGDLRIADRIPRSGAPEGGVECSFQVRMTVRDVNEFIDGLAHEAGMSGTITFARFQGKSNVTYEVDEQSSSFHYLIVNQATGEAEMRYHLEFEGEGGAVYLLEGRKYMERTGRGGVAAIRELLYDYTTLFCHVYQKDSAGGWQELGLAYLKFRTFEDFAAAGNLAGFLGSFRITGTADPILQLQARMRFLAFTGQFVQSEYDPLSPDIGRLALDVQAEVRRGADTPDYFSTRPTADLHAILRDTPGLPLQNLLNTGAVRIDLAGRRIFRDIFWKGSFASDTLLGWEERLRSQGPSGAERAAAIFARGSFWKRFDRIENARAAGHVVNYDLEFLPGDPEVREIDYPDDSRRYFRKGDRILLLTYRNEPYRIVYDTIKVIDENNAIGVMHLGQFPNGLEFAAFVMARHSYPLERMSLDDHERLFGLPELSPAAASELTGEWEGNLVPLENPGTSLLRRIEPASAKLTVAADGSCSLALAGGVSNLTLSQSQVVLETRRIDGNTLLGRASLPSPEASLLASWRRYATLAENKLVLYYFLNRVQAGAATGGGS